MPTFRYHTLAGSAPGPAQLVEAPDRASAVRLLLTRGVAPVALEPVSPDARAGGAARWWRRGGQIGDPAPAAPGEAALQESGALARVLVAGGVRRGMSRAQMAAFVRELATAMQAGLTLVQALRTIARSGHSEAQRRMLGHLIAQVEQGKPLSEAAHAWGPPFNELVVALIRAGEVSGRQGSVLEQAAELLDRDLALRRAVLGALVYPLMLLALVAIAVTVVVAVIVPAILGPLEGQISAADLPLPTRVVQGVAWFIGGYWWLLLGLAAGALLAASRLYRLPGPRLALDGLIIRVPVAGRLLVDAAVARFTRTLATLLGAGLPALSALRLTRATLGNRALERVIEDVADQVQAGRTIAEPLDEARVFPPLLVQIVSVGERSGRLPELLSQAAGALDQRTQMSIKVLTTVLPPLLVILLACVIGFVIASILLPLLQLQEFIA
ncbi:MAG TPA: type II secretion system F family protein [Phycisphaerales bacterium]|nr:type II secretion system F family protein [Phycisphaerales bacterium]